MKHISLFSGQGGFDLAAEWMGWENIAHCEWNPFGQRILKYYWPNAKSYSDITTTSFLSHRGQCDILTGGFPCQPYSTAGKRLGKEDERHLWPHMLRAIREIRPRWVVGENVRGLISWNGGLVFDEVQADLEAEGYEVLPFLLPAVSVNAPHRRERIWFVAYSCGQLDGRPGREKEIDFHRWGAGEYEQNRETIWNRFGPIGSIEFATHTDKLDGDLSRLCSGEVSQLEETGIRGHSSSYPHCIQRREGRVHQIGYTSPERHAGAFDSWNGRRAWKNFPTQSPICTGNDGFPAELDGITFSRWRAEAIKAAGNAIVPQVALQIFKAIDQYENLILQ